MTLNLFDVPAIEDTCQIRPVIPVVKVPSAGAAVNVARALVGGVPLIELTLRLIRFGRSPQRCQT